MKNNNLIITKEVIKMANAPKNGKAVIDLDTGKLYASAKEVAEEFGVYYAYLTTRMKKGKTVHGKHFSYVKDLAYNVEMVIAALTQAKMQASWEARIETERYYAAQQEKMRQIAEIALGA